MYKVNMSRSMKTIPSESGYFINIGNMANKVSALNTAGNGGTTFTVATWAASATGLVSGVVGREAVSTMLQTPGSAILKDLGKTVTSSLRTFRKVQMVVSSLTLSGVTGATVSGSGAGNTPGALGEEYFTGYIEVVGPAGPIITAPGTGALATLLNIAPVARLG